MTQYAKLITRRGPSFPFRNRRNSTPWGGGYIPAEGVPGAVVLGGSTLLNLRTGEVYTDARFPIEGGVA